MMEIYKSIHNPYEVVKMFEEEIANYTGAPYAVAVDSCTDALFLCCMYKGVKEVTIPDRTYLSVPQSIIWAGGSVSLDDGIAWEGIYQLNPYSIYDASKRLTSGMYLQDSLMCLSFHDKKILPIGKGGMILMDSLEAVSWFKSSRYEGRGEISYKQDDLTKIGFNMYMTPEQAARGLTLMRNIPLHNDDQIEEGGYKKLSDYSVFKNYKVTFSV